MIADITGWRFEKLVAVSFSHTHQKNAYWLFRCECGAEVVRAAHSVKRGGQKSCGCHRALVSQGMNRTHGQSETKLYGVWLQMKRRCDNRKLRAWPRYGGRGIRVCAEWSESFEAFSAWAVANGYASGLQIDRANNDGHYEPGNCRWVGRTPQARNRRSNRSLTLNGRSQTLAAWAEESGIDADTIGDRLKRGWSIDRALSQPVRALRR